MIYIVFFHLYQSCLPVSDLSLRQGCDHRQPRNGHLLPVDRNSIYKIGPFPSTTIFFFLEIITLIVVFFLERSISSFNYTELQGSTTDAITLSPLLQRSLLISHSNICITCGSLHQPKHNYIYIYIMVSKSLYPDFESKWEALSSRDEKAARCFFYCVKSTGIYCRPTCAARLARKKNVVFYDTVSEAEAAGFRPCKRCKPMLPLHESHHSVIRATCRLLDNSPKSAPGLKILAENVGFTQWHFHRVFRRFTGMTPRMYWEARHGKMAGKVEDLISQIAQLDENTVIDHELIKRSYKKTAALPTSTKMTSASKVTKVLPLSPNPSEPEEDDDNRTGLSQLKDLEEERQKEVELPFSPVDLFHSAASSNNESFGGLAVESFFYETSENVLSTSESLDEYLSSFTNNETQPSSSVPGDEYFKTLFDQSCLCNSISHDDNSNDNLFSHSSNVNNVSIAGSDLELFDLEPPLGDHEPFNLLDKSLGYYIFSQ